MAEPHATEPQSARREKASLHVPELHGGDGSEAETMEELRELLLAPEQRELDRLRRRISEIQTRERRLLVQEMGEALPSAIALRAAQDDHLAKALGPTIEATLNESVRQNPQGIVEAIFPIIGPAIRRSVSEALEGRHAVVRSDTPAQSLAPERPMAPGGLAHRTALWRGADEPHAPLPRGADFPDRPQHGPAAPARRSPKRSPRRRTLRSSPAC